MRSRTVFLVTGLLVSVALVACGGSDDSDEASPTIPTTAAAGPAGTAGTVTTTPLGGEGGSSANSEFCQLSRSYVDKSDQLARSGGAADTLRQIYQSADQDIKRAYEAAPAEIKPDVKIVADAIGTLVSALERVNWDFTRLTPDAFAGVSTRQFQAAGDRLEIYARDKCGVG